MHDNARGGDDTLTRAAIGSSTCNVLYGDAYAMYDDSRGGNDTLIGGDSAIQRPLWRRPRHARQRPRRQ